ncbi:sigma-70 family RNA polymerase sigma factor [Virgibacillus flavescens]|uniref:sigma-70 family RNA polymerase sigma factor n=1 Tax=Virgibacillus flavescens TaxID=1611422 RepID=UPI003D32BFF6
MEEKKQFTFEEIYEQNNRRIHYHIHNLHINDPHQEFYQEGLFAMWNAYKTYEPDKGVMSTYFNYTIKNRLIDLMRKKSREESNENLCVQEIGNRTYNSNRIRKSNSLIPDISNGSADDSIMWEHIKSVLSERQWNWVYHYIILNKSINEIAEEQGMTIDAVKSLGKHVRKKLRQMEKL